MYLLVMFALSFDGLPSEPLIVSDFNSLAQCQSFLTEYAATNPNYVIKETPVGSITYTEITEEATLFATCAKDTRGDAV